MCHSLYHLIISSTQPTYTWFKFNLHPSASSLSPVRSNLAGMDMINLQKRRRVSSAARSCEMEHELTCFWNIANGGPLPIYNHVLAMRTFLTSMARLNSSMRYLRCCRRISTRLVWIDSVLSLLRGDRMSQCLKDIWSASKTAQLMSRKRSSFDENTVNIKVMDVLGRRLNDCWELFDILPVHRSSICSRTLKE